MSADMGYLLSVFLFLVISAVGAIALWLAVEGVYWLYCKIRGKDY